MNPMEDNPKVWSRARIKRILLADGKCTLCMPGHGCNKRYSPKRGYRKPRYKDKYRMPVRDVVKSYLTEPTFSRDF